MIVLDTNVVSELVRPAPDPHVLAWVDGRDSAELVITVITVAEVRAGVALLPAGRRRDAVGARMESMLAEAFSGQVLAFDMDSTEYYADILAKRRRSGRPIHALDAQIAAICRQYEATLATRNITDFARTGVDVVNPWRAQ